MPLSIIARKRTPTGPTANGLTKSVIDYLTHRHCKAWRNQSVGIYDPTTKRYRKNPNHLKGVPDVLAFTNKGRFIGVEIKVGRDKLSPEQCDFLNEVLCCGGIAIEARNIEQFIEEFETQLSA